MMTAQQGTVWLCPDGLFDGSVVRIGAALAITDGRCCDIRPATEIPSGQSRQQISGLITPGFLDLQVNGGGDVLLNTNPTKAGMLAIAAAHRRFGTIGILPTVITDTPDVLQRAVQAALEAKGERGILGLHIEGPHISVPRRGTHAEHLVRPMDDATIGMVRALREAGLMVMITVAPESVTHEQIGTLAALGAVVSLGHSDTTAEATHASLAAGASCFTHLFNAMSPMLNRAPGVTGAAINSTAYAGVICDGFHVAYEMIGLAIRARPLPDRMFLVSDAMSTVGGSDRFRLYGQDIRLIEGRLVNAEGSLAGAHVTMAESLALLVSKVGVDLAQALRMAVTVPARVIGRPDLALVEGRDAGDLLVLDAKLRLVGSCQDMARQGRTQSA